MPDPAVAYGRVLKDLFSRQVSRGMKLGVDRVRALLDACGAPDQKYPCALVAGTNGKGSTCAFTASLLRKSGARTALYISPHLSRFTQRITVDGEEISPGAVVELYHRVEQQAVKLGLEVTFFELTTVMALMHFAEAKVDCAVLEVGLGGRLDATNAVSPKACAITPLALDHTAILGNTLAAVAAEKAGILRAGIPAVIAPQSPEAAAELVRMATRLGAPLTRLETQDAVAWPLGLLGAHQKVNAAVALRLAVSMGMTLSAARQQQALLTTRWPGRLEWVKGMGVDWLLDGAHNPHGATALGVALGDPTHTPRPWVWVLAASGGRDVTALVCAALDAGAPVPHTVVATQPAVSSAVDAHETATMARAAGVTGVEEEPGLERALLRAALYAQWHGAAVLVWGSLYAVGHARAVLLGEPRDDVPLTG